MKAGVILQQEKFNILKIIANAGLQWAVKCDERLRWKGKRFWFSESIQNCKSVEIQDKLLYCGVGQHNDVNGANFPCCLQLSTDDHKGHVMAIFFGAPPTFLHLKLV